MCLPHMGIEWFSEETHITAEWWWWWWCVGVYVATWLNDDFNIFQLRQHSVLCEQECVFNKGDSRWIFRISLLNYRLGRTTVKCPCFGS